MDKLETLNLYNDDCFNIFPQIEQKSVNLFVLDLPYNQTACKWDQDIIPLDKMWEAIKRIMKPNGIIIHFCTAKFGYRLIHSNYKWFRYDLIWKKSRKVGFLSANKMPLRQHENIYLFKPEQGTYNPQKTEGKPYTDNRSGKRKDKIVYGNIKRKTIKPNKGTRHPTSIIDHENIYLFKPEQGTYNPQKTEGHKSRDRSQNKKRNDKTVYGEIKNGNNTDDTRHPTSIIDHENIYLFKPEQGTYNPQKTEGKPYSNGGVHKKNTVYGDGQGYKGNKKGITERHPTSLIDYDGDSILIYKNPHKTLHRTQKPVELVEWLIKTYSNEKETVMDFAMGSGTSAIACLNTNRKFIGIEKEKEIFDIAQNRIIEHLNI